MTNGDELVAKYYSHVLVDSFAHISSVLIIVSWVIRPVSFLEEWICINHVNWLVESPLMAKKCA